MFAWVVWGGLLEQPHPTRPVSLLQIASNLYGVLISTSTV